MERVHESHYTRINELIELTNNPFDENEWSNLVKNQMFHKMNWRLSYSTERDGHKTNYIKILKSVK